MKKSFNHTIQDKDLKNLSKSVYFADRNKKAEVKIPPSLTKSFMKTNGFYFELKDWKNKKQKNSKQLHYSKEDPKYKSAVVKKDLLEHVLSINKMKSLSELIDSERLLTYKPEHYQQQRKPINENFSKEIDSKKFIENAIKSKFEPYYHKYFGKIPH